MAAQTAVFTQHATLTGATADSVTFSGQGTNSLAVTNRDATQTLYFTIVGTTAVAAADETFVVLPGNTKTLTPCFQKVISIVGTSNPYSAEIF